MSNYLRPKVTGARIFFTVCLAATGSDLLTREVAALRRAVAVTKAERPFGIAAWVVLPDHMHCVWEMPSGDRDFGTRWGAIKARFTREMRGRWGGTPPYPGHRARSPRGMPEFGSVGSGSITSGMNGISPCMWTIATPTR